MACERVPISVPDNRHTHTETKPLTPGLARLNLFDWPFAPSGLPPARGGGTGSLASDTTWRPREFVLSYQKPLLAQRGEYAQSRDLPR